MEEKWLSRGHTEDQQKRDVSQVFRSTLCCLHKQDDFLKAFLKSNEEEVGAMTEGAESFAELSL